MKNLIVYLPCIIASLALMPPASAQTDNGKRLSQFNLDKTVAIEGYDPVAYFTQNKAVAGNKANAYQHGGVTYYFSSKANLEAFQKEPARYEPEYGGWCAYAMGATGEKVEIDPKTFKIKDGKLYLFYNQFFNNTLPKWNKDEVNLKKKADSSWMKFYKVS
ncbi:MAG: YHS domain-containing protein [Flavisolibacter sp.]|nr:YHS domain-containing protein [Flavisolibacter sp.]